MASKNQTRKGTTGLAAYARLHDFVQKRKEEAVDFEKVFGRLQGHLKKSLKGTVLFEVGEGQSWFLNLAEGHVKRGASQTTVDFHVIAKPEALQNILSGKNSPIIAIAKRELAFHGDLELGKSLYKALAADNGKTDPCTN